jgi:quercetin dioxygenase-like cupin family protein
MNQSAIKDPHPNPVGHAAIEGTLDLVISQSNLPKEIQKLHEENAWLERTGPSSKTLVKHPDLRVVLIAMRGKMSMHEHRTTARISIQTLEGRIRLRLGDRNVDLPAGQLLVLDQCVSHDVEAEEDSAFLLTLSWPAGEAGNCETAERKQD